MPLQHTSLLTASINDRAYATVLCPSVCLSSVTYVLWRNGAYYRKTVWRSK